MSAATRERKIKFIESLGTNTDREAVLILYYRYGLDMLTDEQIDEVTAELVRKERFRQRIRVGNRKAYWAAKEAV